MKNKRSVFIRKGVCVRECVRVNEEDDGESVKVREGV